MSASDITPTLGSYEWWQTIGFQTREFLKEYFQPLQIIKNDKREFISWALSAFIVGTFVFWEPVASAWYDNTSKMAAVRDGITHKELLAFGIILLADGFGTVLATRGAGKEQKAAGIRGNIGFIALLVWGINFFLYYHTPPAQPSWKVIYSHLFAALLSATLAVFLYCLRKNDWEPSAGDIPKTVQAETKALSNEARDKTATADGDSL